MLVFRGRYTLDCGLQGMQSLFETSDWRHQVIAINQLVDIKRGLLRSPEDRNRQPSDLDSVVSLHSLILQCFLCLQVIYLYLFFFYLTLDFCDLIIFLSSKVKVLVCATGLQELHWVYP